MSKKENAKDVLDRLVNSDMPKVMELIIAEKDTAAEVKAARVSLANTALHHLRLLRGAYEK